MKTIIIWGCILLVMCGVIAIPVMEEDWHIKNDSTFRPKYELVNSFNQDSTTTMYDKDALN